MQIAIDQLKCKVEGDQTETDTDFNSPSALSSYTRNNDTGHTHQHALPERPTKRNIVQGNTHSAVIQQQTVTTFEKWNRDLKEEASWENIYAHVCKTSPEP